MIMRNILRYGAVLGVFALLGVGCNPFARLQSNVEDRLGSSVAERIVEQATGGGADVKFGSSVKLPANFPSVVPRYPDAVYVSAMVLREGKQALANLQTKDDPEKVAKWYEEKITEAGFKLDADVAFGGIVKIYAKGDVKITIQIGAQGDDGQTLASIHYIEEE